MHARTFHGLCASAFALTALGGFLLAAVAPHHAGGHGLLLAILLAVAFGIAAWLQPAASSLCAACHGPKGSGVDFCVTCGAPRPAAERA